MKFCLDQTPPTKNEIEERRNSLFEKHIFVRNIVFVSSVIFLAVVILTISRVLPYFYFTITGFVFVLFGFACFSLSKHPSSWFTREVFMVTDLNNKWPDECLQVANWCRENQILCSYFNTVIDQDRLLTMGEHAMFENFMISQQNKNRT